MRWVFFDPGWSGVLSRSCRNKSGLDLCPGRSATCQIGLAWRLLGSDLATRARDDRYGPRCQARWQSSPPSACGGVGNDPDSRQRRRPELSRTRRRPSSGSLWAHAPAVGGRALVLLNQGRRRRARACAARRDTCAHALILRARTGAITRGGRLRACAARQQQQSTRRAVLSQHARCPRTGARVSEAAGWVDRMAVPSFATSRAVPCPGGIPPCRTAPPAAE